MSRAARLLSRTLAVAAALGGLGAPLASFAQGFATERVVAPGVLDRPVYVGSPPGDFERLFILEQHAGRIRILRLSDGSVLETPFLTIGGLANGNEQGLLGLAFHPDYANNGRFYVNYTQSDRTSVIAEYVASQDPDVADPGERRLLEIAQPQSNHNGGWMDFGPNDGYLYIGIGDGGGGNDSGTGHTADTGNAQDITDNLLGKILRIDVDRDDFPQDASRNYGIPATNPFVGETGDDEIWAYGLRNPWRASFDPVTFDLYVGDVGQNTREEIDVIPDQQGGLNLGWRLREGTEATPTGGVGGDPPEGAVDPIFSYLHSGLLNGCSVTGGIVYRGPVAALDGRYFFADYCTAELWSFVFTGDDPVDFDGTNFSDFRIHASDPPFVPDAGSFATISSFGVDAEGNLYIVKLGEPDGFGVLPDSGEIFRVPEPHALLLQVSGLLLLAALRLRSSR